MCEADLAPRIAGGGHLEAECITQSVLTSLLIWYQFNRYPQKEI